MITNPLSVRVAGAVGFNQLSLLVCPHCCVGLLIRYFLVVAEANRCLRQGLQALIFERTYLYGVYMSAEIYILVGVLANLHERSAT
jgi:hypothetical protein